MFFLILDFILTGLTLVASVGTIVILSIILLVMVFNFIVGVIDNIVWHFELKSLKRKQEQSC